MAGKNSHDWDELKNVLVAGLRAKKCEPTWNDCARFIGVNAATFRTALQREWKFKHPKDLIGEALVEDLPTKMGLDVTENGNILDINYVGEHAHSLDDLIRICKVDLSVWVCDDYKPNSWESAMKVKRMIDGETVEVVVVVPLYQIKAYFRRAAPTAIMPMIQPVEVVITDVRERYVADADTSPSADNHVRRALIVPDPQIGFRRRLHNHSLDPFHDRRVLDLAVQIALSERFDSIEFIGDFLDMSEFSTRWTPEPEFFWTTQPALIEASWWLGAFSFVPVKRLLEGNHERRIRDWINQYARIVYGLRPVDELDLPASLSVERLIPMDKLGVQYIKGYPGNGYWLNDNIFVEHGDMARSAPGATAGAVINKSTYTTVFAHIHRRELVSRRIKTQAGDAIQNAFCPGCACRIDGAVPGSTGKDQWQNGLGVIEYTRTSQNIIPVAVENGEAIYRGRLFSSRPTAEMDAEINDMIQSRLDSMNM